MKEIPLTRGRVAVVDDEDFPIVSKYKWQVVGKGYAERGLQVHNRRVGIYMHRFILNAPKGTQIDHVNGDTLDNRKCNLRFCNTSENARNSRLRARNKSGYRGVWIYKYQSTILWQAAITLNRKQHYLGLFSTPEDAAHAYDRAARDLHGEFARTNFPEEAAPR